MRDIESELYDLATNTQFYKYDDDDNESINVSGINDFLNDLMLLGDMASNILRELTDPKSIPDYRGLLDPPIQTDKRDYLDRE